MASHPRCQSLRQTWGHRWCRGRGAREVTKSAEGLQWRRGEGSSAARVCSPTMASPLLRPRCGHEAETQALRVQRREQRRGWHQQRRRSAEQMRAHRYHCPGPRGHSCQDCCSDWVCRRLGGRQGWSQDRLRDRHRAVFAQTPSASPLAASSVHQRHHRRCVPAHAQQPRFGHPTPPCTSRGQLEMHVEVRVPWRPLLWSSLPLWG